MTRRSPLALAFSLALLLTLGAGGLAWALHAGYLGPAPFSTYWASRWPTLLGATVVGLILLIAFRVMGLTHRRRTQQRRSAGLRTFETLTTALLVVFVAIALLEGFGTAIVSLGLVRFGLTLALQRPILSMAGWGVIRFGRLFREGDRIEIDGIVGDVLEITLLKTKLWEIGSHWSPLPWGGTTSPLRQTGRIVTVSNATFLERPLANATGDFDYVFDEFVATVAYEADWKFGRSLLEEVAARVIEPAAHARAAAEYRRITSTIDMMGEFPDRPVVIMVLNPDWIEFRLRYLVPVRQRSATGARLAVEWQTASEAHPDRLPQVYRRTQPMAVGGDGRALPPGAPRPPSSG